jgi:spore germination protein
MEIYVVQPGDTIELIADRFGISVEKLVQDNGINDRDRLIIGQSLVIAKPEQIYIVKDGDTLLDIANTFNISVIQLLANNPFLSEREFIYPGETIIISYKTKSKITVHGTTIPFVSRDILKKTLPHLTYLSVLNYTATRAGEIISYYDDTEVIQLAKEYGVAPLMLLTTLTIRGEANLRVAFDLLLNEEFQDIQIENLINILKTKGYYGINMSFQYVSRSNIQLYENLFTKTVKRVTEEGFQVFLTVNPNLSTIDNNVKFEQVNYSYLIQSSQNIIFTSYEWSSRITPPAPINSYQEIDQFLNYLSNYISLDKVIIGIATIGYDWELPYVSGFSNVYNMTLESALGTASDVEAIIQFDEVSQTPYFTYISDENIEHIVWFVNARSINSTLELVSKYNLRGISVFNITAYTPQLWLIISQYEIEKVY